MSRCVLSWGCHSVRATVMLWLTDLVFASSCIHGLWQSLTKWMNLHSISVLLDNSTVTKQMQLTFVCVCDRKRASAVWVGDGWNTIISIIVVQRYVGDLTILHALCCFLSRMTDQNFIGEIALDTHSEVLVGAIANTVPRASDWFNPSMPSMALLYRDTRTVFGFHSCAYHEVWLKCEMA